MNEIEQRLLDELESLEKRREKELTLYEESLKDTAKSLATSYQESMIKIFNLTSIEATKSTELLESLMIQQQQILNALKEKPSHQRTKEQLDKILMPLFIELEQVLVDSLESSNKNLVQEIKNLL